MTKTTTKNTTKNYLLRTLTEGLDQRKSDSIRKLLDIIDSAISESEKQAAIAALTECLLRQKSSARPVAKLQEKERSSALQEHRLYVAQKIIEFRTKKKWTQSQLAEASGLPQPHISRIENCNLAPTHLTISKIAEALGVTMEQIDHGFKFDAK